MEDGDGVLYFIEVGLDANTGGEIKPHTPDGPVGADVGG